jgi:hypothetical protein
MNRARSTSCPCPACSVARRQADRWRGLVLRRLHKLQQKEEQRQQVAQMAKAMPAQEEELGWDDLEEEMAKAMPAQGGEEEEDDASLADSADIEAELRNLTPSPDPDQQEAAGLASPQYSGSTLEQVRCWGAAGPPHPGGRTARLLAWEPVRCGTAVTAP